MQHAQHHLAELEAAESPATYRTADDKRGAPREEESAFLNI